MARQKRKYTKLSGIPKPAKTGRQCLKCRQLFNSTGPGNRICSTCRCSNADASGIQDYNLRSVLPKGKSLG